MKEKVISISRNGKMKQVVQHYELGYKNKKGKPNIRASISKRNATNKFNRIRNGGQGTIN